MKGTTKKILALSMATLLTAGGVAACGKKGGTEIDPNKIQVYVYVLGDGYGDGYMEKLVDDFNGQLGADTAYQFVWVHGDDGIANVQQELTAGLCEDKNIYISTKYNTSFAEMVANGQIMDISDVYETEVDGKKIKDKVTDFNVVKNAYSKYDGTGVYALPHATSISNALVFDYTHFLRKGYMLYAAESELAAVNAQYPDSAKVVAGSTLDASKYFRDGGNVLVATKAFGNYKEGEVVLSAGKDGKYGTYDDGQHTTLAGFDSLLEKIAGMNDYAYVYTTQFDYSSTVFAHTFYQYLGYENTKVFESFNGDFKDANGNVIMTANLDNANQLWDTDLVKNAYNIAAEYYHNTILGHRASDVNSMLNPGTYFNGPTISYAHDDAQQQFALEHNDKTSKETAFLIEGSWWENEARGTLEQLGGYGADAVEHRFYLTPYIDGQAGKANETVFSGSQGTSFCAYLNNYPKKVTTDEDKAAYDAVVKQFLAYTCSDSALNHYTKTHGLKAYFDYEITEDTLASITPFQKNTIAMLADTDNIKIVDSSSLNNTNVMKSRLETPNFSALQAGVTYTSVYAALSGTTPSVDYTQFYDCVKAKVNSVYASNLAMAKDFLG